MGAHQPSLLTGDHPPTIHIEIKVGATGEYIWGRMTMLEHSGRKSVVHIPHTPLSAQVLSLPDDMRDVFTAWLYTRAEECRRTLRKAIERWQDDCDEEGGHPAHNR